MMITMSDSNRDQLEEIFLEELRHHISGWRSKVENTFTRRSYEHELSNLKRDPVYSNFALDSPEYVLVRFIGRISISIGRRLGEIYDKLARSVAEARFGLSPEQVAPKFNNLKIDVGLRFAHLNYDDVHHIRVVINNYLQISGLYDGVGIEIRYNFNPNDSARLRKDVNMAGHLQNANLLPVYLIFSSISPRSDAVARLKRAGWNFLIGRTAGDFARELLGLDLTRILEKPEIKAELQRELDKIMTKIFKSYAFQEIAEKYKDG